jgi:hypothetical protein
MARWAFNDITVCFATEAFWSEELAAARVVAAREFMFHVERWLGMSLIGDLCSTSSDGFRHFTFNAPDG